MSGEISKARETVSCKMSIVWYENKLEEGLKEIVQSKKTVKIKRKQHDCRSHGVAKSVLLNKSKFSYIYFK